MYTDNLDEKTPNKTHTYIQTHIYKNTHTQKYV